MVTIGDQNGSALETLKRVVTGYDRLGQGTDFESFKVLKFYDVENSAWTLRRSDLPLTLLSKGQLDLIERLLVDIGNRGVAGDCIEAGVWRGGAVIMMRAVLDACGMADRQVIAADSFAGIPPSTQFLHDPVNAWPDRWVASLAEVKANIAGLGYSDDRIEFLEGLFTDSLTAMAGRRLAFIRLDSDSYDSVMDSLTWLYPLLMPGGVIVVDDWHLFGCRFAINSYRKRHNIHDPIQVSHGNGYWFKSQPFGQPPFMPGIKPGG